MQRVRESMEDYKAYGWTLGDEKALLKSWIGHNGTNVQNHIKSLNFKYRVELRERKSSMRKSWHLSRMTLILLK